MRVLPILLALAGCTAAAGVDSAGSESALSREIARRSAGEPVDCVSMSNTVSLQVAEPGTVVYRDGRTLYVNRLVDACPGLRPLDTLIVEANGSRYCRGDRVRAVSAGLSIPGPVCVLGKFTPYR